MDAPRGPDAQDVAAASPGARAALYEALSGLFARELTRDGWLRLCTAKTRASLRQLALEGGVAREAEAVLRSLAASHGRDPGAEAEALAVDYARLFLGPGPGLAPPYESIYTTPGRRFYGEALSEVLAVLRDEGMQVGEDFGAPADHLAVELAIMRHLVERTATRGRDGASSDAEGLRRQLEFLDRHLLRWVPQWAADVARGSTTDFYRSAAGMLDAFLQRDRASLRRALDGRPS